MLLLLDNFERAGTAAPLVADLLGACPISRSWRRAGEPLRLYGEGRNTQCRARKPIRRCIALTLEAVAASAPFNSLPSAPRPCARTSPSTRPTRPRWRRFAGGSTGRRWPSNWRRRACITSRPQELLARFGAAYAGNGEVSATFTVLRSDLRNIPTAIARCGRRLPGATTFSRRRNSVYSVGWQSLVGGWTVEAAAGHSAAANQPPRSSLCFVAARQAVDLPRQTRPAPCVTMLETLRLRAGSVAPHGRKA